MAKNCNNCTEKMVENQNVTVPYVVHEATVARQERQIKRMWIALIVAVSMLFFTNMIWIGYESQFETISYDYDQNGEGTNIIGNGNEVNDGAEIETEDQTEEEE